MAGDDERLVFVSLEELIGIGDRPSLLGVGKRALSEVGIRGLQRFANGLQTDSVTIELVRVRFDAHGGTSAAPGEDLADTFHLREFLGKYRIGGIVNLGGWDIV